MKKTIFWTTLLISSCGYCLFSQTLAHSNPMTYQEKLNGVCSRLVDFLSDQYYLQTAVLKQDSVQLVHWQSYQNSSVDLDEDKRGSDRHW